MRFMQFRAHDKYALHLSKMEKVKRDVYIRIEYALQPYCVPANNHCSIIK